MLDRRARTAASRLAASLYRGRRAIRGMRLKRFRGIELTMALVTIGCLALLGVTFLMSSAGFLDWLAGVLVNIFAALALGVAALFDHQEA
ncbi:hypothetical protein GCM10009682_15200 [Luedemannella flava]|uniref:Uncharacterized protein n=2 Tax=Luedemannella flava TaxID=349316 RepID=A0ABN2LN74_9ACTN